MKNKKGFTLIELLAVIVVLAIIALIAVPMVLNTIEKSRKGAAQSSAYAFINKLEETIMKNMIYSTDYSSNLNSVTEHDDLFTNVNDNLKGNKPTYVNLTLANGVVTGGSLCINDYYIEIQADGTALATDDECTASPEGSGSGSQGGSSSSSSSEITEEKAGLFAADGSTVASWEELKEKHDIETFVSNSSNQFYYQLMMNNYPTATKLVVPNTVTNFNCGFVQAPLTEIVIDAENIGEKVFQMLGQGQSTQVSITLKSNVRTIARQAFDSANITSITLNEGLTTIGEQFLNNANVQSITIPASVTTISASSFFKNDNHRNDFSVTFANPNNWYVVSNNGNIGPIEWSRQSSSDLTGGNVRVWNDTTGVSYDHVPVIRVS